MKDYEFTLRFRLPQTDADPAQYIDALGAAGCDDALIGIGQPGRIALDFTRAAATAFEAIAGAIHDVAKVIPGASLIEATPDLVGLTEVSEMAGFSRQNMRKLSLGNAATFPPAIHDGKPTLWHLADILEWLQTHHQRDVDSGLMEVARTNMLVNIAKEARRLPGASLPGELEALFG